MKITYKEILEKALAFWRQERAIEFSKAGLVVDKIYESGKFEELPPRCLMAVCYVDAYASALRNYESLGDEPMNCSDFKEMDRLNDFVGNIGTEEQ